jgi:hypothetical protein
MLHTLGRRGRSPWSLQHSRYPSLALQSGLFLVLAHLGWSRNIARRRHQAITTKIALLQQRGGKNSWWKFRGNWHCGSVFPASPKTRSHRRSSDMVDVEKIPAAPTYRAAASGGPPTTLGRPLGFDVGYPLTSESLHRLCTVGVLPVALARMGMRMDRSLLLEH